MVVEDAPPLGHGRFAPCLDVQGGQDGRDGHRPPPGAQCKCFACPDKNRGEYRLDIICDACRQTGHVAANCDVLAIALFIKKYKRDIPDNMKDQIESNWPA